MASLEKWVDELQAAVDKLTKRVASAVASAFKPELTDPTDGQAIVYDATAGKWVNGPAVPVPVPANPLLLINYGTTVDNIMVLSDDGVSAWVSGGAQLKSGTGDFTSFVMSQDADILPADYDTFSASYTLQSTDHTEDVTLDQTQFTDGVIYNFGVYFKVDTNGCEVGMCYAPKLRPQEITLVPISTGTGASGDVIVSSISLSKSLTTSKRRTKK